MRNEDNIHLISLLINVYRKKGDRKNSLKLAKQLVSRHSDNWTGYHKLAEEFLFLEQFEEAEKVINDETYWKIQIIIIWN